MSFRVLFLSLSHSAIITMETQFKWVHECLCVSCLIIAWFKSDRLHFRWGNFPMCGRLYFYFTSLAYWLCWHFDGEILFYFFENEKWFNYRVSLEKLIIFLTFYHIFIGVLSNLIKVNSYEKLLWSKNWRFESLKLRKIYDLYTCPFFAIEH